MLSIEFLGNKISRHPVPRKSHRRRHRKKLHIGEFSQKLIEIDIKFAIRPVPVSSKMRDTLFDSLFDMIESSRFTLGFSAGNDASLRIALEEPHPDDATGQDVEALIHRLEARHGPIDCARWSMSDLWYDS